MRILVFVVLNILIVGCASNREIIAEISSSSRQNVFQEVPLSQAEIPGKSLLQVEFQVKNFSSTISSAVMPSIPIRHTQPSWISMVRQLLCRMNQFWRIWQVMLGIILKQGLDGNII